MKIKNFKCKCGHNDFFIADKGNQKGIYCSYCGKWLKWADKDEQNLVMNQEPIKSVLEDIKAEIENMLSDGMIHKKTVLGIIDKYISGK